eukprot:scpid66255/ scgid1791/ 
MDCQNAVELEVMEDDDSSNQQVITESPVVGESESRTLSGSVQVEETPPAALAAAAVTGLETNDIGDLASTASTLAPDVKLRLVHHRTPGPDVVLPSKEYKDSKRTSGVYTRHCKRDWFAMFDFISYSENAKGIFCLPCVLFPAATAHGGARKASILVSKPLINWKDAVADLKQHEKLQYHLDSATKLAAFCKSMEKPAARIDCQLSSITQQRMEKNRKVIGSITKCLELCGRQGIVLRGHRDDSTAEDEFHKGKLKAVINFRVSSGDTVLEEHLASCGRNATYISKTS